MYIAHGTIIIRSIGINDKLGMWQMTLEMDGKVVADKTFELIADTDEP